MELRHLLVLRELADRGTVAATAAALRVSPSAVSQQLRSAEREWGARLVEPDGRGVRLTDAGRLLADAAVDVAGAMASVQRRWDEFTGSVGGVVSIATLPSAGTVLLPGLLNRLQDTGIELRIEDHDVAEGRYADLARDYDLVIGHRMTEHPPAEWAALARFDLLREPIDVAMPTEHPLAGATSVRAKDLAGENWVGVPAGFPFDDLRKELEAKARKPFQVRQRLRDNNLVAALIVAGVGIGLLPRLSTPPTDGLVLKPLTGVNAARIISALARPEVARRAAPRHLMDTMAQTAAPR